MTNSSTHAVELQGVGKTYRSYRKPLDRLKEILLRRSFHQEFRALEDISFSLPKGGTLGIIGDNGAGKSTLLHLLCGVLRPSAGELRISGKVLGLLELGVGFNPEFSGRENIFFYADLLGLERAYVQAKYQEIIAFSELGNFIEQPIKTYSTGMTMRLAFSLVSSLEPEVLVVDEALAVGDLHFQKKCIDRMMAIRDSGCTILFCSHSTYQVTMFCEQTLWLKDGRLRLLGPSHEVVTQYEAYQAGKGLELKEQADRAAGHPVWIKHFAVRNPLPISTGDDLVFDLEVESSQPDLAYQVALSLKMDNGRGVFVTATHLKGMPPLSGALRRLVMTYPKVPLMGGIYIAHARIFDAQGLVLLHDRAILDLEVRRDSLEMGICRLDNRWEVE
jgi:lipopolysaccharide transport system ATP-binding protein